MKCEQCESTHDGSYGSGRFCTSKCARGFSTKEKRKSINEKVSSALGGKPSKLQGRAGKKHDTETKERISQSLKNYYYIEHPEKVLTEEERTIVLYESPHRLVKCLGQIEEFMGGERKVCVVREISKMFEETFRGNVEESKSHFTQKPPKGEFVVCLEGFQ